MPVEKEEEKKVVKEKTVAFCRGIRVHMCRGMLVFGQLHELCVIALSF